MSSLRITKNVLRTSFLIVIAAIAYPHFFPLKANAQAIITTVADVLANPDKYDGNMVQVGGWVSSLQFIWSGKAGPYTTFKLSNQSDKTLSLVRLGILPIREGDFVSVTARYKKSDRLIWIYSIKGPS